MAKGERSLSNHTQPLSPNLLPDGLSPRLPATQLPSGPRPLPRYSQERGHRGGAGRTSAARSPAGAAVLRLQWRAGRLCPRPRKPPAPPAAAEASQPPRIATAAAAAAAVAALLPRGSRSAPASTRAGPNARR